MKGFARLRVDKAHHNMGNGNTRRNKWHTVKLMLLCKATRSDAPADTTSVAKRRTQACNRHNKRS
eukprot:222380-Pelagomonas_calceolata.AAC.3